MSRPRHWRPTPLIRLSWLIHAAAPAAWLLWPAYWPWPLAALLANHAALTAAGLWPRSRLLGPNLLRLPPQAAARGEIAITIDDGPDAELTPQVLEILARHDARASFFCIGTQAQAHPELVAAIVRAGHSVENHSQHHRHGFSLLGPRGMRSEVAAGQATLAALAGTAPQFFRAPAGLRNPFLEPVLAALGLQLASWTRRGFDTRVGDPQRVLARLTRDLAAGDILLLHDGHAARSETGQPVILEVLPRLLQACEAAGLKPVPLPEAFR